MDLNTDTSDSDSDTVSRKPRSTWSASNLEKALQLVSSKKMSQKKASQRFGIPRTTLRRYTQNQVSTKKKLGRPPFLNEQQEKDLVERILRLASVGFPITSASVRRSVFTYCLKNKIKNPFNQFRRSAGKDWFRSFMKRHPTLSKRKPQHLNEARAQKLNKFIVKDHFKKLEDLMNKLGIRHHPEKLFNTDEKGIRLCKHKSTPVVAARGAKRVHTRTQEHGENVTVVACVSALGHAIPPMILFKGQKCKPEWKDCLPPGTLVEMTPKGSMTAQKFVKFLEHLAKYKPPGHCLLILDGAKCHMDLSIALKAEELEIEMFCMPSNCTHELQPLDKSCFKPLENAWDYQLELFWSNSESAGDRTMNKMRFQHVLTPAWDMAMTAKNIKSGFQACGVYPFNPDVLPEEAYAPSSVKIIQMDEMGNLIEPATEPATDVDSSTPNSFSEILKTPEIKKKSARKPRKAINSRAVHLQKNLFQDERLPSPDPNSDEEDQIRMLEMEEEVPPVQALPVENSSQEVIKEGDYVIGKLIYNFGTRREFEKKYVGVVLLKQKRRPGIQYEVSFLRKQKLVLVDGEESHYFIYPNIPDKWQLDREQILKKIQLVKNVRGKHYFLDVPYNEIECNE